MTNETHRSDALHATATHPTPTRDALIDAVGEDPALSPIEKETSITFAKDDDRADVFTAEAGLMRRLIAHPEAMLKWLNVAGGNATHPRVSPEGYTTGEVVGVAATLPVATLSVLSSPREDTGHARVITHQVLRE